MVDDWIGKAVLEYMKENRYSQAYLSKEIGMSPDKMSASLNGKRRFTFSEYALICGVLGGKHRLFLKAEIAER